MNRAPIVLLLVALNPPILQAGPTGRILGRVTAEDGGAPVASEFVWLFDSSGASLSLLNTDGNGDYVFDGLVSGNYHVVTFASPWYNEVWDDIPCNLSLASCTITKGDPIGVVDGLDTTGIDFSLAEGGRITGTIKDATSGDPITVGVVRVFDETGDSATLDLVGVDGAYLAGGLDTGTFFVTVTVGVDDDYVPEVYDDIRCDGCDPTTGTPISVTFNDTTSGIDFALLPAVIFSDGFESGDTSGWD